MHRTVKPSKKGNHMAKKKWRGFFWILPSFSGVGDSVYISGSITIFMLLRGKKLPFIRYNFSKVRINIIVILDVIFVVRGRGLLIFVTDVSIR